MYGNDMLALYLTNIKTKYRIIITMSNSGTGPVPVMTEVLCSEFLQENVIDFLSLSLK